MSDKIKIALNITAYVVLAVDAIIICVKFKEPILEAMTPRTSECVMFTERLFDAEEDGYMYRIVVHDGLDMLYFYTTDDYELAGFSCPLGRLLIKNDLVEMVTTEYTITRLK